MAKKIILQINFDLGKIKKGDRINIDVDDHGIPTDKFWRRRLKDSEIDHCVEIISDAQQKKSVENNKGVNV